jgi:acid phosphatase (class A)
MQKLFPASLLVLALIAPAQLSVAQAPMPIEPAQPTYVTSAQVDVMKLLPPPPALQSEEQTRDLDKLLAIQKVRTRAQEQRALADATADTFGFADVLGPMFTAAALPKLAHFMDKVRGDGAAIENIGKEHWKRPRPFETSKEIQIVGNPPAGSSYPSGMSTVGYLTAVVLASMDQRRPRRYSHAGGKPASIVSYSACIIQRMSRPDDY